MDKENLIKGERFIVLSQASTMYVKPGDIVIALEDDDVPFCVKEDEFIYGIDSYEGYENSEPLIIGTDIVPCNMVHS